MVIPALWESFGEHYSVLAVPVPEKAFGLCCMDQCNADESAMNYMAAVEWQGHNEIPAPFLLAEFPGGSYARFLHRGDHAEINLTLEYIFSVWLPKSKYCYAGGWELQEFSIASNRQSLKDERFYYLPIK